MTEKKEPSRKEKLADLRRQMDENASYNTGVVHIRKPWVYVEFETHWEINGVSSHHRLWGLAKICWPDRWSKKFGVDLAIRRALAWGAKDALNFEEEGVSFDSDSLGDHFERFET
jgi:hypothetical protein